MDNDGTTGEAGRWLSYAELAEARGITRKAAARLTLRHRWRRQPGNDGAVRVWVPDGDMTHRQTPRHAPTAMTAPDIEAALTAANSRADAALAVADRALAQLAEAQARADRLDLLVQTERGRIVAIEAKAAAAEQGREAEQARADEMRGRLDDFAAKLTDAQAELAAAQEATKASSAEVLMLARKVNEAAEADAERRARGLLARLRAAWRRE